MRGASERLRAVTGRAPSGAFCARITTPGVTGNGHPPIAAIAQLPEAAREADPAFPHVVCEAHLERGADLNRPEAHAAIAADLGLDLGPDPAATPTLPWHACGRMQASASPVSRP
jgi:hypothetical protein